MFNRSKFQNVFERLPGRLWARDKTNLETLQISPRHQGNKRDTRAVITCNNSYPFFSLLSLTIPSLSRNLVSKLAYVKLVGRAGVEIDVWMLLI